MRTLLLPLVLLSTATLAPSLRAQCGLDDQLDASTCCASADLQLPTFPNFELPSKGLRWDACGLADEGCLRVTVSSPVPSVTCGVFDVNLRVADCPGNDLLDGAGTLTYARTWIESRPQSAVAPPTEFQVWRFLLKVQVTPVAPVALLGALFPNALQNCPDVYYYGHVDYALDCNTNQFEHSLSMYHGADRFSHGSLFSACPSTLDPESSYAIVGPHNNAFPFVAADLPVVAGALTTEGVRKVFNPVTLVCFAQENLAAGSYNPVVFGCLTPVIIGSLHLASIDLNGAGVCGTQFVALNIASPSVPWRRLISTSLGTWTSNVRYPGPEALRADEGLFYYRDGCNPAFNEDFAVFQGVETVGGYDLLPGPGTSFPGSDHFVDLGSAWTAPTTGPITFPAVGFVGPTKFVIGVNPE